MKNEYQTKTITTEDLELIQDAIEQSISKLKLVIEYASHTEEWAEEIVELLQEANYTIEYVSL